MTDKNYDLTATLENLSKDALSTFEEIASKVNHLQPMDGASLTAGHHDIFASTNSFTGGNAHELYNNIREDGFNALQRLKSEPVISKVVFEDDDGEHHIRYIARVSVAGVSISSNNLMSKRHPLSSLASMPVGESKVIEFLGKEQDLTVIETTSFLPKFNGEWDSLLSIYKHEQFGTKEIKSLRAFFAKQDDVDAFDALFDEENDLDVNIEDGISHKIITAMGLRDQPILDQFQDEIFRQPLKTQRFILGPPGTGKTTTLIQRLGQKRDVEYLDEREKKIAIKDFSGFSHEDSWVMFTPTELLKHYVKEAILKEGIPAPEDKIKTWESHRKYIARNVFNLLQIGVDSGKFILKSNVSCLKPEVQHESIEWFEQIKLAHNNRLHGQLLDGVKLLESTKNQSTTAIVEQLTKVVKKATSDNLVPLYEKLLPLESEIKKLVEQEKESVDKNVRETLRPIYQKDKTILGKLAVFLNELSADSELEDSDDFDNDTNDSMNITKHNNKSASNEYIKTIKALARQTYLKRNLGKSSRAYAIVQWLGKEVPDKELLIDIGRLVTFQNGLRRFIGAHKRYILDIPSSYKIFRKESNKNKLYYQGVPEVTKYISGDELDAVLLLTLENTHGLLSSKAIRLQLDNSSFSYLYQYAGALKNQVLVDEATDFSIIQLACMHRLCHPDTQSFFACGDFNQRIAKTGVDSVAKLEWFIEKSKIQRINAVYRQSCKLNIFAKELLEITGGDIDSLGIIPRDINHDGVAPVLAEKISISNVGPWLSERIKEINSAVNVTHSGLTIVPTIAVLVRDESQVESIANELNILLEDINLSVEACKDGKSLGDSSGVRVFAIEHIKGLEFEAVFFIDIDSLAKNSPELYEKYLYVGVTRAATYLGMTCSEQLPEKLEPLRTLMVDRF